MMEKELNVSTVTLAVALQLAAQVINRLNDKNLLSTKYPDTNLPMNETVMCGQIATALMVKFGEAKC